MPTKYTREPLYVIGPSIAYIPLTQGQFTCVDWSDAASLAQWNWSACRKPQRGLFYAQRGNYPTGIVLMHRHLMNCSDALHVDHRNLYTLDNRRANLRLATPSQNHWNTRILKTNSTGFKGVYRHSKNGNYVARITINGRGIHLGCRDTPEEAHKLYRKKAAEICGEFARFE